MDYERFIKVAHKNIAVSNEVIKNKAQEMGLSYGEATAIMFFAKNPQLSTAAHMVKECGVSKAFASKIMLSLMKKKLVTITTDQKDKRNHIITLSKTAVDIAEAVEKAFYEHLAYVMGGLTDNEENVLSHIITKLEKNIEEKISR